MVQPNQIKFTADTFQYNVMAYLDADDYERALKEVDRFRHSKFDIPSTLSRISRYLDHSEDLIRSVKNKRQMKKVKHLRASQIADLNRREHQDINEIKTALLKIEQAKRQARLQDSRSTIWLYRGIVQTIAVIFLVGFVVDLSHGLYQTGETVIGNEMQKIVRAVFPY